VTIPTLFSALHFAVEWPIATTDAVGHDHIAHRLAISPGNAAPTSSRATNVVITLVMNRAAVLDTVIFLKYRVQNHERATGIVIFDKSILRVSKGVVSSRCAPLFD
jgi:hypothetical protein